MIYLSTSCISGGAQIYIEVITALQKNYGDFFKVMDLTFITPDLIDGYKPIFLFKFKMKKIKACKVPNVDWNIIYPILFKNPDIITMWNIDIDKYKSDFEKSFQCLPFRKFVTLTLPYCT